MPNGLTHFVVVWRRHRRWLQVMDPAIGRRWVGAAAFRDEVYRHDAGAGRRLARVGRLDEFRDPLRARLAGSALARRGDGLLGEALADRLDALRRARRRSAHGAVAGRLGRDRRRRAAGRILRSLRALCREDPASERHGHPGRVLVGAAAVSPPGDTEERVLLRGAVLLRVRGARPDGGRHCAGRPLARAGRRAGRAPARPGASCCGCSAKTASCAWRSPLRALRGRAGRDRRGAAVPRPVRFGRLLDLAASGSPPSACCSRRRSPRAARAADPPRRLRPGRHLETRLRMALLRKLPRLDDRYFQSRPISDMADRSHGLHLMRGLPGLGAAAADAVRAGADPRRRHLDRAGQRAARAAARRRGARRAAAGAAAAERARPARAQPCGALNGFYLDALLGLVPVRAHRARGARARASTRACWSNGRAPRAASRVALLADGRAGLLVHRPGRLLLVSTSRCRRRRRRRRRPAAGVLGAQAARARQRCSPSRSRSRPSATCCCACWSRSARPRTARRRRSTVSAAGVGAAAAAGSGSSFAARRASSPPATTILREVDLSVAPGEHVAIVGPSGAGKSTLVGLLLGWHRLAAGTCCVDGEPLGGAQLEALRRDTAWVDPAVQLWNQRARSTTSRYGAPRRRPRAPIAAIRRRSWRRARALPEGLQTLLGEGGALVSGGEGQRVRLGRALMRPDVAAGAARRAVPRPRPRAARARCWPRRAAGGAARRCSASPTTSARRCGFDRVLVVEDGRIVEDGAPASCWRPAPSRYRALLGAEREVRRAAVARRGLAPADHGAAAGLADAPAR